MAINDDIYVDTTNKLVRREAAAGSTIYTTNALYSFLQDQFDELSASEGGISFQVPMSAQTPTDYTMINGWYIQEELTHYLETGAIQSSGWEDEIHTVDFQSGGYTNAVAADLGKTVNDDGVDFGTLVDYNNTTRQWHIRTGSATTMASGSAVTIDSGTGAGTTSAISVTGETIYANPYTLGTIESGTDIYVEQDGAVLTSWWATGHIDILVRVQSAGTLIDSGNLTIYAREFGDTYDFATAALSAGGRSPVAIATAADPNNETAEATVEDNQDGTTATIAIAYGSYTVDVTGDGIDENYEFQVDCDGERLSDVYEVLKYWTRSDSSTTLDSTEGEIYQAADAAYTPVKASPLGTFAGGKLFLARGGYLTNLHASDIQAYELIDSGGTTRVPPNAQAISVTSLGNGDNVIVALASAGDIDKTQYSLDGANGLNTITVTGSIPADTPTTGSIVVVDDDGSETVYAYSAWSGSDFTVTISASTYSGTETAYVPYILDTSDGSDLNVSLVYVTDRSIITRVRQSGILPFEIEGTFGSTGVTVPAIRTTDSIVS